MDGAAYRGGMVAQRWRVSRGELAVAGLVAAVQIGVTTAASFHQHALAPRPFGIGGYLLLGLGPLLLIWRNRYPASVLIGVFGCTLAYVLLDYPRGPVYLALIVAFVHAVIHGRRLVAYPLLAVGYLSLTLLPAAVSDRDRPSLPSLVGIAAWLLVLLVGSELIRIRKAYGQERYRRRREAELTREEEVRRRASEERLQIARELHDVMAHSISLINVQAGVALELMDARPEQARQALTAIKAASKEALIEVQSMLSTLRGPLDPHLTPGLGGGSNSGPDSGLNAGPGPGPGPGAGFGLAHLEQLIARVRLAGLPVSTELIGVPVPLEAALDQAAGRIVQEALTNVARHATGEQTRVRVEYVSMPTSTPTRSPDSAGETAVSVRVLVEVENDGPAAGRTASSPSVETGFGGRGIAGMRERAAAFGGSLQAGPRPDGGFLVRAELPVRPVDQTSPTQCRQAVKP